MSLDNFNKTEKLDIFIAPKDYYMINNKNEKIILYNYLLFLYR